MDIRLRVVVGSVEEDWEMEEEDSAEEAEVEED